VTIWVHELTCNHDPGVGYLAPGLKGMNPETDYSNELPAGRVFMFKGRAKSRLILSLSVAAGLGLGPTAVVAQESSDGPTLEEVTVTATKREEAIQDIPISIQAVTGDVLDDFVITDIQDLSASVPNLIIGYGITAQSVSIRGLGSGQDRSFEQSVGMFIDGVYLPRSRQYRNPFFDIERVEVMRGPQAVIHGLNSTAGAISVVTRRNQGGDAFEAEFIADAELEYGGYGFSAAAGGGIGDNFGLRASVKVSDYDGWMYNNFDDTELGDIEDTLVRLSAVWSITDNVALIGKVERSEYDVFGGPGEIYGGIAGILEPNDGIVNWQQNVDASLVDPLGVLPLADPGVDSEYDLYSLGLEWGIGTNTLSVLAARSEFTYDTALDLDTTFLNIIDAGIDEDYEQTSIEAKLISASGGAFEYILGLYYHDTTLRNGQPNIYGEGALGPGIGLEATGIFEVDSTLLSPFAQGTWHASETLRLVFGARYSDEDKDVYRDSRCFLAILPETLVPAPPPLAAALCPSAELNGFTDSRSSSNFMPEVAVQWEFSDSTMLYGKVSDSAKAGGFSSSTNSARDDLEYDDESALGLEAGLKSRSADGRFEWNLTAFRTEFDDLQVNSFRVETIDGVIKTFPKITNAASAISQGIEADLRWAATNWLTLGASVAWLDATYDDYKDGNCNSQNEDPNPTGSCDLSGKALPYAPDFQGTAFADLFVPLGSRINLVGGLLVSYSDSYFTEGTLDPFMVQDSYTRVDARIGIAAASNRWSLSLVGKNLGDEAIVGSSQGFGSYNLAYAEPPRRIFLQGTLRFGD
jgi:iron complex outermembrane receptor protein